MFVIQIIQLRVSFDGKWTSSSNLAWSKVWWSWDQKSQSWESGSCHLYVSHQQRCCWGCGMDSRWRKWWDQQQLWGTGFSFSMIPLKKKGSSESRWSCFQNCVWRGEFKQLKEWTVLCHPVSLKEGHVDGDAGIVLLRKPSLVSLGVVQVTPLTAWPSFVKL